MKRILFFTLGMFLSLTVQAAVVYQSAAYGSGTTSNSGYCSNCSLASDQFIGETFSTSTANMISGLDFYAQSAFSGTGDLTIGFFDAPDSLVHSQTFTLAEQTKTVVDISGQMTNVSVTFNPFHLAAGNYAVFFFGQDLAINYFNGFGSTQLWVMPSIGVPTSDPLFTGGSSAIRISGTLTAVPEPEVFSMLSLGIVAVVAYPRRRKHNK